jgi:hypothetical protein
MRWCELFEDNAIVPNDKPDVASSPDASSEEERARLLQLAKSRGLNLSPPQITPEQIMQAANAPPVARMLVTDKTTPAEISAFIRGRQHGG